MTKGKNHWIASLDDYLAEAIQNSLNLKIFYYAWETLKN